MSDAATVTLCDALVAHLQAGSYSRPIRPRWEWLQPVDVTDLGTTHVILVPAVQAHLGRSCSSRLHGRRLRLFVLRRVESIQQSDVNPWARLVEELAARLETYVSADETLRVVECDAAPREEIETKALSENNLFKAVVPVDCEVLR